MRGAVGLAGAFRGSPVCVSERARLEGGIARGGVGGLAMLPRGRERGVDVRGKLKSQ